MGYYVPSAENVYRYVFRADDRSNKLSDGFSWSILFINDNSDVCKIFLKKYGLELCYRTAERIRFVFFSGLDQRQTENLINQRNSNSGGLLSTIIKSVTAWISPYERYDWERYPWERNRPEGFYPLDSREKIEQHLSFECEVHSAMPGSEEAFKLAQKIGVGRFVPCFLFFSDAGQKHAYLLPVAHSNPDYIYDRLKEFIDSFYEINSRTISYWNEIEDKIEAFIRKLKTSVYEVEALKRKHEKSWKNLKKFNHYLDQLDSLQNKDFIFKKIAEDWDFADDPRRFVKTYINKTNEIETLEKKSTEVINWVRDFPNDYETQDVFDHYSKFPSQHYYIFPNVLRDIIIKTDKLFKPILYPPHFRSEIFEWWKSEKGRHFSRNYFDKFRKNWVNYSKLKFGEDASGRSAIIIRNEYDVVLNSILSEPIATMPKQAAIKVINLLAIHIGVSSVDSEWNNCTATFENALIKYFTNLKDSAPKSLYILNSRLSNVLRWVDCIPSFVDRERFGLKQCFTDLPYLNKFDIEFDLERPKIIQELDENLLNEKVQILNELKKTIVEWIASLKILDDDKQNLLSNLISSLTILRQSMENDFFNEISSIPATSFPGEKLSKSETNDLFKLIDNYEDAVSSIVYPYENDPEIFKLGLDKPLLNILELTDTNSDVFNRSEKNYNKIIEDIKDAENSESDWENTKIEMASLSPGGQLFIALNKIINGDRLLELFPDINVKTADAYIQSLSTRQKIVGILNRLNVQELMALERATYQMQNTEIQSGSSTKQSLFQSIMKSISLPSHFEEKATLVVDSELLFGKIMNLTEKMNNNEFDVFLAHNSMDKHIILQLGEILRSNGIYPWIDIEQIPPGRWFQDVLQSSIRKMKAAAIMIGTSGIGKWQALELRTFLSLCIENAIPLIPVLLPGVKKIPEELLFLRELNMVVFSKDISEIDPIKRLIWGITGNKQI